MAHLLCFVSAVCLQNALHSINLVLACTVLRLLVDAALACCTKAGTQGAGLVNTVLVRHLQRRVFSAALVHRMVRLLTVSEVVGSILLSTVHILTTVLAHPTLFDVRYTPR